MTTDVDEEELAEAGPAPEQSMSMVTFVIVLVGLTLVAVGAGFMGGLQIVASVEQNAPKEEEDRKISPGELQLKAANIRVLSPIVTNLAGTPQVWMRLESSLVFQDEVPGDADALAAQISEDIVAFLRTVPVAQIEGAIGFQHLSEDLNDRVRVRSNGRVQELIIQGLIVE